MKDSNFSRDFKKDFKTIYSRIENIYSTVVNQNKEVLNGLQGY